MCDLQLQSLGLQGAKSIEMVRLATQNMSNADFAAALSTTALTEAQKLQLIAGRNLSTEELELALSTNASSVANAGATTTTFSLANAFNKLKLSMRGVAAASISNPITAVITIALTAITVISQVKSHIEQAAEEAKQKVEEAASSIQQIGDKFKQTSETMAKIGERFAELAQGVDAFTGKNKSLTSDEYAEFLNLSNQLAEVFPTLTRHYDENGNAIVDLSGDVDTIVGSLQNLLDIQQQLAYRDIADKLPTLFEGTLQKSNDFKREISDIENRISTLTTNLDKLNSVEITLDDNGNVIYGSKGVSFDKDNEQYGTSILHINNNNVEEWEDATKKYEAMLDSISEKAGFTYKSVGALDDISFDIAMNVNQDAMGWDVDYIIDWTGMSDKEIKDVQQRIEDGFDKIKGQYNVEIENLQNELISIKNKNKANWSGLTQSLVAWLQTDSSYQALDDEMRIIVQKTLNGVDFSEISFDNWDDVTDYITKYIIDPISQASPEAQAALRGLFDIDFATATLDDYFNAIKPYLTAIALALGKTEEEVIKMLNIDNYITDFNARATKRNTILSNYSDYQAGGYKGLDDWLNSLSPDDLDIVYKISTEYTSEKVKEQLETYQDGGSVNLFLRPKVDNSELKKAGWDVSDDGYATVFTGTYSNTAGTIAANFTPIIADENGDFKGVLSPDEFTRYCEDVLDGVREDDLKLQIGATFDGENAIEEADKAAGEIHILQDYLYDLGDPSSFNLDKWKYALGQFKLAVAEPLSAFNELLNDKGTAKDPHFIDRVEKYVEKINKLNSAYEKLSKGEFSDEDFTKLINDFPTLATRADDLGFAINELKDAMNSEMDNDFADQFGQMNTDADVEALEAYRQAILSVGKTVDLATSLYAGDSNKTQKIINNASKIQSLLNSQKGGKSVSLEDFNSDEFKDYKKALEYVNGAVQLNEEKVVEITKAKAKEQIAINKSNKALSQAKYLDNARQINVYRKCLADANNERDQLTYQTKIDSLIAENENIAEACKQYDFLSKTLQEATDSYQHWLNAQNASDYGDMMSDTEDAIKLISDTLDETSDIYGQVGSKKYQAALDLIVPDSVDRNDMTAVKQYMENLKKYFYFDEDGAIAGMDIQGFIQKSLSAGLMVFDSANQEYKIAGGKTMESFVEGLKLSSGMVQAFFDEMQLYGGKFDWSDEIGKSIDELYNGIEDINALPHFKDITLKLDFSDISTAEGQIKAIDEEIEKVNKVKATPNIDSSELQYANDILVYLTEQKQQLTAPAIMEVDTSQVDSKYQEAIGLTQEYQNTLNTKELYAIKGLDTKDLDKKLAETEQKIQNINPKIKTELDLDTTSKDGIETFIKNFDPNKYPKVVNFKANTDEVDEATKEVSKPIDRDVNYVAQGLNNLPNDLPDIDVNVNYHRNVDGDIDIPGYVNGTAHASGTAKIGGDWGTAKGGKTLVGELGREIVVDVHTGRWYTVGDRGAEFVDIPAGSIVFNHIQSQSLLENGYVSGRAHALASGTAMVTGGIGLPGVQASTARKNRIEAEIAKATASELADSTPDGGDNNAEDSFKYIDRVEILLDRIHRKIESVKDAISDVFSLWSTRGDNITKQIANITDEIDTQQAAAERYLEEARKQIDKYDLDPAWVKKLETGSISFAYLTNLDELHEGYLEYQKWFEKYLDSRDTIAGLERDLSQLYKDQFDNIKKAYDNQIDLSEYLRDSEEKTYTQSTKYFDDMRGVYSKNLELLTSEAKDLEEQLQKAVDSDAVEVGSEAWQEMKKDVNSVTKEIAKTNVELAKLYTEQFDYIQSNYQNQISSYESLNDANEKNFTATTNYYAEMREISTKTLKAQQNELADLNKEFNEAMDSGRIEEGSEAWYKMKGAIDDTTRSVAKTRVELKQLYLDQMEYIDNGYKNQIASYQSIHDANEKSFTATTNYYKEMRDIARKTLKSQMDDLADLEKEYYNAMSDPNNPIEKGSEAWYEMWNKIKDVQRDISATRVNLKQLYLDEFDYVQNGYQNELSLYNHYANVYSKKQTLLETQGYMTSRTLLNEQANLQQRNVSKLTEELIALQTEYNAIMDSDEIDRYSEKWYELTEKINGVKEALLEARIEMEKIENAKEELAEAGFSLRQSLVTDLKDESDFYINIMSFVDLYNKRGQLTDAGLAALGLHNYNVDVNKALKEGYDSEIARIDEKYADDQYNTKYLEYRRQLIKSRQESIIAIENEEKAMISMAENGIKTELDSLKELIQTYKDSIDVAKSLYDYQKNIADKSKSVVEIQKQLSAYTNDTSEETKATVQKLKVSLEDAQKDLDETEYTQMVADQKKLLDEVYDEYEKFLNSRLDNRDALLNDLKNAVNAVPGAISQSLNDVANTVGIPLSNTMANTWEQAAKNIEDWNKTHAADQQITEQALKDSATTWGDFGDKLITEQNRLNNLEGNLVTATNNSTQGINQIWGDIGVRGGQTLIEKADEDYTKIRGGAIDDTNDIRNDITDSHNAIVSAINKNKNSIISIDTASITGGIGTTNNKLTTIGEGIGEINKTAKAILDEAERHIGTYYLGDVDLNESVTSADALEILRASTGQVELTDIQKTVADIDKDGSITAADALAALRISTGIQDSEFLELELEELEKKVAGYSKGGLNKQTGLAMLHGTKSKPELVLEPTDTQNFIKLNDTLRDVMKTQSLDLFGKTFGIEAPKLQLANIPSFISGISAANQTQDIQIINNIEIDHVEGYDDLVRKLRTDTKFEDMITSMTVGKLNGGRGIDKYKYRW